MSKQSTKTGKPTKTITKHQSSTKRTIVAKQNNNEYEVIITIRVQGGTESERANTAHELLVRHGLGAGSVRMKPARFENAEKKASLDALFEEEPRASLDFLFEDEDDAV
jgi:hypothetical protein